MTNFEVVEGKLIAYKSFQSSYTPPEQWVIEPGSVIEETVNMLPTTSCACGVNVATLDWCLSDTRKDIWKVEIELIWLIGAVVPYHTDGKFRVPKARLVEIVRPSKI